MTMKPIGILYDNISGNTGDVAIGLSIKKILHDMGVEFDELIPGNFNPSDYDTILIGGGHLIRHSPDFFYDKFKVPGNHILNAVGILGSPDDLGYLNDYKYITVRSSWDKEKLSYLNKEVYVVPCTTMILEDLENIPVIPKDNSIGIHLLPNIFSEEEERQFIEWISKLPFNIYFIPITHYNQDYIYMEKLSSKIDNSELLPLMNPLEIFTFIGGLDYFISCSLHGGIFSYRHNVPFVLFNYNEKMLYFMKDRGYEQHTFKNFEDLVKSFERILINPPNYAEMISRDLNALEEHIDKIHDILPTTQPFERKTTSNAAEASLAIYQIHNLQSQLRAYESEHKNAIEHIQSLKYRFFQAETRAYQLENKIAEMQSSIFWQIKMKYDKCVLEPKLPQYTRRRRMYDLVLEGGKIAINEGPKQAIFELYQYLRRNISKSAGNRPVIISSNHYCDYKCDMSHSLERNYILDLFERASSKKSLDYVFESEYHIELNESDLKFIAFYLPQYHPIPENDSWWGKGFTDWTNVSKAIPQFVGHYQPHIPGDLGFYDLRLSEVQAKQIDIARKYGIYGFCFHYYWFAGKRLLERPLDQFLKNPDLNFKFCICWANENWTRRWDGQENEVLISQTHSSENDFHFIEDIEHILRDPRYIRINGRPVLVVYRLSLLPDGKATADRWRTYCRDKGLGDLYLIAAQTFGFKDPRTQGFDAAVEFPPHLHQLPGIRRINDNLNIMNPLFNGTVFDFDDFVKSKTYLEIPTYKLYKTVCPGWDNSARRPNNPTILHGSNPENFKEWLRNIAEWTLETSRSEERIIFINAWNEWAEGAHLEPDRKYGYGYLQSISDIIKEVRMLEK